MEQVEINVNDGNRYVFTTALVNVRNPLGVVATLKKYAVFKLADAPIFIGNVYRTKDGKWYEMPGNNAIDTLLNAMVKTAIEKAEKKDIPVYAHASH